MAHIAGAIQISFENIGKIGFPGTSAPRWISVATPENNVQTIT